MRQKIKKGKLEAFSAETVAMISLALANVLLPKRGFRINVQRELYRSALN